MKLSRIVNRKGKEIEANRGTESFGFEAESRVSVKNLKVCTWPELRK